MGIGSFFFGSPPKNQQYNTLNPEQNSLLQKLLGSVNPSQFQLQNSPVYQSGSSYLQSLLGGNINDFAQPYINEFNQQTIPGLAEQFAGVGGLSSSGFQNAATGAGANLQAMLASLRGGLQNQALGQGLSYAAGPGSQQFDFARLGLGTPSFGQTYMPRTPGFLETFLGGLSPGIGQGLGLGIGSYFNQGRF